MAVCLRSSGFRSCNSFVIVARRYLHSESFDFKAYSVNPYLKKMSVSGQSLVILPRSCELHSNGISNLQVFSDGVLYAQEFKACKKVPNEADENLRRADKAQLEHVTNVLIEDLPELFNKNMNYKIYHPNMIFENNIRGTKTIGIINYMREMFILKIIGNIRFSHVKFTILKITDHPEDGTVRVRWRIVGISQFKNILRMIRQRSQNFVEPEGWYDGFSIFYVRSDGLIHKHIVDKMIPDKYDEEKISSLKNRLAAKVGLALGVSLKDCSMGTPAFEKLQVKSRCPSRVIFTLEANKPTLKLKFCNSEL